MNVGELVLLPAVRRASKQTLIIADGFSCREQIRQGTDREALHTAQVLQLALEQSGVAQTRTNSRNYSPDGSPYPEKTFSQEREHERLRAQRQAAFKFGAAAALGVLLWASKRKRVAL
jgi:hypothetical protein